MSLFSLLIVAFSIVSLWFILTKVGEEGWKSLIPFYNGYMLFKISGKRNLWGGYLAALIAEIILLPIGYLLFFVGAFRSDSLAIVGLIVLILAFIMTIIGIILNIKMNIALGHKFGKSGGFIVGMILLNIVFYGILAFDKNIEFDAEAE